MPRLAQSQLYWRGTVFNRTDGIKWTRIGQIPAELPDNAGQKISQVIFPEPTVTRTLIALDRPATLALQRVTRSPDGVFELSRYPGRRLSYSADSQINGLTVQRNTINRQFYLQLPDRLPTRIRALAAEIVRTGKDDRAKVNFLEDYFRKGGFRYSMKDLATGDKALEQFLFGKKQGNCEFFASSFALLLRAAGVACRLVGGYLGGEYNDLGGYYIVTDDKAHVWVEAFIKGLGWLRIDPSGYAINAGDVWKAPGSRSLKLSISMALDSFNYVWNRSVITYDFEQQMNVARQVGSRLQGINPAKVLRSSVPYFAGGLLLAGVLFVVSKVSLFSSREQRILNRFFKTIVHRFSVSTGKGGVGLFEIALAAENSHVSDFVEIYAGAVYHDRKLSDDEYHKLQQILRVMRSEKSKSP
jgi:transglutaminase-like putative cysteine protease